MINYKSPTDSTTSTPVERQTLQVEDEYYEWTEEWTSKYYEWTNK